MDRLYSQKKDIPYYDGLLKSLRFFVETILPIAMGNLNALKNVSGAANEIDDAQGCFITV